MKRVITFLKSLNWKRHVSGSQTWYESPDSVHAVTISGDWWELRHFTDSDVDGVAVGRYVPDAEGETLAELKLALLEAGVL